VLYLGIVPTSILAADTTLNKHKDFQHSEIHIWCEVNICVLIVTYIRMYFVYTLL